MATARPARPCGARGRHANRGDRGFLDHVTWRLGPGERAGWSASTARARPRCRGCWPGRSARGRRATARPAVVSGDGRVVRGSTLRIGHLSQELTELDQAQRLREAVEEIRPCSGRQQTVGGAAAQRLGFSAERQSTPVSDLSGGERRRLQMLRLLMTQPNVLLLDEPTNDLDIEMLTEFEDLLDGWPGTLVVVSHDRYFLERITDHVDALLGDGRISALPGGVDDYLERVRARRAALAAAPAQGPARPGSAAPANAVTAWPPARRPSVPPARNCSAWSGGSSAPRPGGRAAHGTGASATDYESSPNSAPSCVPCRLRGRSSKSAGSRPRALSNCDLLLEVLCPWSA